jgi:hypothetical protein
MKRAGIALGEEPRTKASQFLSTVDIEHYVR